MNGLGGADDVAWRELSTVARTKSYILLSVGLLAVFVGLLRGGGGIERGYVPAAVDLLLAIELLVPLVAVALGYRAFGGDNDDRAVLSTYPVTTLSLVAGVFVGRLVGLAAIVGGPLVAVGIGLSWVDTPSVAVFATHRGADSPILFIRFIALTLCFGAVVLAMAMAASVLVRTSRASLAAALAVLVAVIAGGDLLALAGLAAGSIGDDALGTMLAASPNAAYRGLVLETVVGVTTDRGSAIDAPVAVVGLVGWLFVSLGVVGVGIDRRPFSGLRSSIRRFTDRVIGDPNQ